MARKVLTSLENPLQIGEITVGINGGIIGLTFAPGKHQSNALSGVHKRDLQADLDRIAAWKAAVVVTLVETHELESLGILGLGDEVRRRAMEWCHWPIKDYGVPDEHFEAAWPARSARLRSLLANGGRVLIHCKGGLGRAGTIGARLLVEMGLEPRKAIATVRDPNVRGSKAIETEQQERWIALGREMLLPDPNKDRDAGTTAARGPDDLADPGSKRTLGQSFAAEWMTGDWTLRERLAALANFRPIFEREDFKLAEFRPSRRDGDLTILGGHALVSEGDKFLTAIHDFGWVRMFDWAAWRTSRDGERFMNDRSAIASATEDDLARIITVCARADRFSDGYFADACQIGLITRVVIRADELLKEIEANFGPVVNSPSQKTDSAPPSRPQEENSARIAKHPRRETTPISARDQDQSLDWFQKITGFKEDGYQDTQKKLEVFDGHFRSLVNGRAYRTGTLELVSLGTLRRRGADRKRGTGRSSFRNIVGDARALHRLAEYEGALFQVASQFNLLEMIQPDVTPEQGVTRYQNDGTQGPACAIAAGAATIYRNYLIPIDGQRGQTRSRQLDGLADLGQALSIQLGKPIDSFWIMRNGYALCSASGLEEIGAYLKSLAEPESDKLRSLLRVGVHTDVEVTDDDRNPPGIVSQAFCSALPVAYTNVPKSLWSAFAELVLEAAYEATLLAGAMNAARGRSNIVLLTRLGGGAFGNDRAWIDNAIKRGLRLVEDYGLDIRMVNYQSVPAEMKALESEYR